MCLSTVYKDKKTDENVLAEYVEKIDVNGNELIFTDVMGAVTKVKGHLLSVDLNGGGIVYTVA